MIDASQTIVRTVRFVGRRYQRGDIVRVAYTPTASPPWFIVEDERGDHEILRCWDAGTVQDQILAVELRRIR